MMNKIKKALKNNKGFTLIELIIVIAVVVLLASITIPSYLNVLDSAKEAEVTSAARNGYLAVMVEYTENLVDVSTSATAATDYSAAAVAATGLAAAGSSTDAGVFVDESGKDTGVFIVYVTIDGYTAACNQYGVASAKTSGSLTLPTGS